MTTTAPKKQMQLNFYEVACTGMPNAIGQWKNPSDNSRGKDRLDYYIWLAKIAEKGKISCLFFADSYGELTIYQGKPDAQYRAGNHAAKLEPTLLVGAMAAVTKSVGFGITGSTSYIPPYQLARSWSTLDHITNGRIAWNIVTSFSQSSAKAFGLDDLPPHDERYNSAEEYMDIVYQLWEKSWEDGVQTWQAEPEMAYDPSKIHKVDYNGKYLKFSGRGSAHPSPQRTPLIFQAGASKAGIQFGGKHAEAIFCANSTMPECKKYVETVRAAAAAEGRDPKSIKFFLGAMVFVGRTQEEGEAKYEDKKAARKLVSIEGGLARFSGLGNIDMSVYPIDEPFKFSGDIKENAIHGFINGLPYIGDKKELTPRDLGELLAFGGLGPRPIGSAEHVADVLEQWVNECDIDGFNLSPVSNPGSWEDVVELLVPELQRRGLYWNDYPVPGGTIRENVSNTPGQPFLAKTHPGSKIELNGSKANGVKA